MIEGSIIGLTKGDTRRLDCSSIGLGFKVWSDILQGISRDVRS